MGCLVNLQGHFYMQGVRSSDGNSRNFFPRSLGSWKEISVAQTNKQTKKQSGSLVMLGVFFINNTNSINFTYNSATYNNNIHERIT